MEDGRLFANKLHDAGRKYKQKGEIPMKKYLVKSLMLGALLLVLAGSAYAHDFFHGPGDWNNWNNGGHRRCNVPEPSSIALLSSGMAGIGLFSFIKRKNRK
jgi:PEP-CTERM motif